MKEDVEMGAQGPPSPVEGADLLALLRTILVIRGFEERALDLRKTDEISGSVHVCVGQEIVPALVWSLLDRQDRVLSTYRGHGWAIGAGVPLDELMGELMGRSGGTNGGRGGSAYLSAPDRGFLGENSIVGAGLPISNGVAMALKARGDSGVAVVSFGDGATNQGAVHEALVFAVAKQLPVVFVCENNSWSEMTPIRETVPDVELFERARSYGMNATKLHADKVTDMVAGMTQALNQARTGTGPVFVEVEVPRLLGHYNADIEHYRPREDKEAHAARDPLAAVRSELTARGLLDDAGYRDLLEAVHLEIEDAVSRARRMSEADGQTARDHVAAVVPSITRRGAQAGPAHKTMKYGLAVNRALSTEMRARDEMVVFGEDIAVAGGTFGVTRNLQREFGDGRVFDTPIAETAILGAALGASLEGLLPVVEIMWSDFVFVALDQIVNQMANVRYLSNGKVTAPVVIRMQQGATPGSCAQHSQCIEAILAHIPGIKVGLPSSSNDAFEMTRAAIADPDPVVLVEARSLYLDEGAVDLAAPVSPVGGARLLHEGDGLLVVSWGSTVRKADEAVRTLREEGREIGLLDLRWLNPLDVDALLDAAEAAGWRVLVVHEANLTGGFGAEIAARILSHAPLSVRPVVERLALPDVRVPAAPSLQNALLPSPEAIAAAIRDIIERCGTDAARPTPRTI